MDDRRAGPRAGDRFRRHLLGAVGDVRALRLHHTLVDRDLDDRLLHGVCLRASSLNKALGHRIDIPPSTRWTLPVIQEDSSLARKMPRRTTSSGWPTRPRGMRLSVLGSFSGSASQPGWLIGVSMTPGAIAFTRMFCGA